MVSMPPRSLQSMDSYFPLKLEDYGEESRDMGVMRVSPKKRELPLKLHKSEERESEDGFP